MVPFATGWAPFNIASSALFFLAVPALSVIGILLAGWSSRNTYASIGGIRGAAQMISYELPRTLSVLSLCLLAGSISTVGIRDAWRWWWIPLTAIGFLVYFIASIAELNRGPFDLPEAESELVAGYFADYSGIRWAIFMMVEYGGMVAASLFGAALFFGGGLGLPGAAGGDRVRGSRRAVRDGDDLGEVDVPAHAARPAHGPRVEGPHADGAGPAPGRRGGDRVAVGPEARWGSVPDRTSTSVSLKVSATNDFSPGVRGFFERWASMFTGLAITGGRMGVKPTDAALPRREAHALAALARRAAADRASSAETTSPRSSRRRPSTTRIIEELYGADKLPPCVGNCPANVDARGQAYHLAEDRFAEAYELVRERNTMPGVLGRICHHPCETACKRNYYDEPIAIRPLHRVAYERYAEVREERVKPLPQTRGQNVAIIGSGPSGLTAALDLMRLGYGVTVYEKDHHPGGALYSGVPAYRLPRDVLKQEVDDLVTMGMDLRLNVAIGDDVPIDHLIGEYDAVLIATGLQESRIIPIPGADAEGVVGALEFLKAGNWKNDAGVKGKRVLVVGRRQRRRGLRAGRAARGRHRGHDDRARVDGRAAGAPVGDRGGARRGRHRELLLGTATPCSSRTAKSSACACSRACRSSTRRAASHRSSPRSSPTWPPT